MTRWFWAAIAAIVVIAVGVLFWQSRDRGTVTAPVAQAPPVAPAAPTVAQAPSTTVAAATGEKEPPTPPAAPTAAQVPGANPAAPTAEKEPTGPPAAPTAAQAPATEAPAPTGEKESTAAPPAPAAAQAPATTNAAAPTAEKEPAPAAPTAAQPPATNVAAATGEKEPASQPDETNAKATAELASLKPGFNPKDLIAALNDSKINFRSDSDEVPASAAPFLQSAAEDLKQMPAGYVLEIAGYTDNTGDAAMNVTLSQKRADAVRDALVKLGAQADMLVAKGYGSADPIASNDTPEGRLRNRRIEYHLMKTP